MICANCGEPVRRAEPRDGLGKNDVDVSTDGLQWVHDSGPGKRGSPFCDVLPVAEPADDFTIRIWHELWDATGGEP